MKAILASSCALLLACAGCGPGGTIDEELVKCENAFQCQAKLVDVQAYFDQESIPLSRIDGDWSRPVPAHVQVWSAANPGPYQLNLVFVDDTLVQGQYFYRNLTYLAGRRAWAPCVADCSSTAIVTRSHQERGLQVRLDWYSSPGEARQFRVLMENRGPNTLFLDTPLLFGSGMALIRSDQPTPELKGRVAGSACAVPLLPLEPGSEWSEVRLIEDVEGSAGLAQVNQRIQISVAVVYHDSPEAMARVATSNTVDLKLKGE